MALCSNCGFELPATGACPVCRKTGGDSAASDSSQEKRRAGGRTLLAGIVIGALVIAGALGVYIMWPSKQDAPVAVPASTPVQSAQPALGAAPAAAAVIAAEAKPAFDITTRTEVMPIDDKAIWIKWMAGRTKETEALLAAKWERSLEVLKRPDITDPRILRAFLATPRQYFCRPYNVKNAYADTAIPIGYGQTISGPHMVSRMTQSIDPQPNDRVLEIGTGSGYQAAVLSELSNRVFTIEIVPELVKENEDIYKNWETAYPQYKNIKRKVDDGYYGWPEFAPFDKIIVTCGIDHIPPPLLQQLAPGGIMVIPVGPPSGQTVLKITKTVAPDGSVRLEREDIYKGKRKNIVFVPFTKQGKGVHSLQDDQPAGEGAR